MKKICISKGWSFSSPEQQGKTVIDLPHDYSIALPRNPKSVGGPNNGYFEGTRGIYEKYMNFGNTAIRHCLD